LKDAAVEAARQWQFSPTQLSGVAVKVIGTLTFNFEPRSRPEPPPQNNRVDPTNGIDPFFLS